MEVYMLQHIYHTEESEETKIIGIYSTKERALEAIERLKTKPGFIDYPEGFEVEIYILDRDEWEDGFVTV